MKLWHVVTSGCDLAREDDTPKHISVLYNWIYIRRIRHVGERLKRNSIRNNIVHTFEFDVNPTAGGPTSTIFTFQMRETFASDSKNISYIEASMWSYVNGRFVCLFDYNSDYASSIWVDRMNAISRDWRHTTDAAILFGMFLRMLYWYTKDLREFEMELVKLGSERYSVMDFVNWDLLFNDIDRKKALDEYNEYALIISFRPVDTNV